MTTRSGPRTAREAERAKRAARILDAAGDLLVAWGYTKITIEDVARRAGVGKGTVYLHFPTKEALFSVVLVRTQLEVGNHLLERFREDPRAILPSSIAREIHLAQERWPILKALLTSDTSTLGSMITAVNETRGDLIEGRARVMLAYTELLRGHGLLRDERTAEQQNYVFVSSVLGALATPPLLELQSYPLPDSATRADILAETVHRALESPASPEALLAARDEVLPLFDALLATARDVLAEYLPATR
ncbi:TetR/AcrR family transcriptional regulator [Nocardiopsis ganjiahuensis]|uniref:TetR/AcrR family transcriptional regulator n=1 Tax=Nocardiopsis ganjiahuensis TaxID=239984 RepID=UPI000348D790|nr:TetR family transcriptional regulator [Nocardiopsis ganjiahuensis]